MCDVLKGLVISTMFIKSALVIQDLSKQPKQMVQLQKVRYGVSIILLQDTVRNNQMPRYL